MYRFILLLVIIWPLNVWAGFAEGIAAYERGYGKTARAELLPLAQRGEADAQYYLGRLYYYDVKGVRKDYRMSAKWFHRAARQGHAAAQYKLGGMYFSGRGVNPDDRKASKWWRLAGAQGHAEARNNLGAMFANGRGVPQSLIIAYALQTMAHANGNELAAENMRTKEILMSVAEIDTAKRLAHEMSQPGMFSAALDNYIHTLNP
ncbi:MAG TPA: sel1 repeat family protein [Desulfobulbaceae bacterium]|nr:MAG: hypothetical protein A2520_03780 [Deltaproteobacteria bacterium RIFOXYD12_FULL_53_23]HCC53716.1 sel1 repeat family protein [Desulfobulbaceae bacterium]